MLIELAAHIYLLAWHSSFRLHSSASAIVNVVAAGYQKLENENLRAVISISSITAAKQICNANGEPKQSGPHVCDLGITQGTQSLTISDLVLGLSAPILGESLVDNLGASPQL